MQASQAVMDRDTAALDRSRAQYLADKEAYDAATAEAAELLPEGKLFSQEQEPAPIWGVVGGKFVKVVPESTADGSNP
jgi:hypothetical protein